MELLMGSDMRLKKYVFWFVGFSIFFIIWKLNVIESDVDKLQFLKETLFLNKEQLQLSHQQLILIEHLYQEKIGNSLPLIYAITPTYKRPVQKAELTRISQTLALVPNVHWIVVEDSPEKTDVVINLLNDSKLLYTHLCASTSSSDRMIKKGTKVMPHRGVEQRNEALKWLRSTFTLGRDKGVVYFLDDDNTYSVKLFKEIAKVKKVGVWPVGLVGGLNAEAPVLDPNTGKVIKWQTGWRPDRPFAIDMAGFAINLDLVLAKPDAVFSRQMKHGFMESEFLNYFTTKEELEPFADNCTKVYVWHTRTEKPQISGIIEGLEV